MYPCEFKQTVSELNSESELTFHSFDPMKIIDFVTTLSVNFVHKSLFYLLFFKVGFASFYVLHPQTQGAIHVNL